jgi:hypothetical protein
MPICPTTELMNLQGLAVSYRGSDQPQLLEINLEARGKTEIPVPPLSVRSVIWGISNGAAGGAEFAPTVGAASLKKGSIDSTDKKAAGPKWSWTIELAGVSPLFMRVLVDLMANTGSINKPAQKLVITGSLPLDTSPLSVREPTVITWLDDFDAYPAAFANPGFPIGFNVIPRGLTVKLELVNEANAALVEQLTMLFAMWGNVTVLYPNAAREKPMIAVADPMPKVSRKKREVIARWDMFDAYAPPKMAVLTNMLARFHATTSPIAAVEYSHG